MDERVDCQTGAAKSRPGAQPRAQLDAAFRQGEHTGIQLILTVKKASVVSVYRLISAISTRATRNHCSVETNA